MSRVKEVLRNKNKIEKQQSKRRKEEIAALRNAAAFKARLYEDLKKIDVLLDSDEVESVVITVQEQFLPLFGEAIYSEDLAEYDITQVDGKSTEFEVRHKFLQI